LRENKRILQNYSKSITYLSEACNHRLSDEDGAISIDLSFRIGLETNKTTVYSNPSVYVSLKARQTLELKDLHCFACVSMHNINTTV
jgi:hypothetical protein